MSSNSRKNTLLEAVSAKEVIIHSLQKKKKKSKLTAFLIVKIILCHLKWDFFEEREFPSIKHN